MPRALVSQQLGRELLCSQSSKHPRHRGTPRRGSSSRCPALPRLGGDSTGCVSLPRSRRGICGFITLMARFSSPSACFALAGVSGAVAWAVTVPFVLGHVLAGLMPSGCAVTPGWRTLRAAQVPAATPARLPPAGEHVWQPARPATPSHRASLPKHRAGGGTAPWLSQGCPPEMGTSPKRGAVQWMTAAPPRSWHFRSPAEVLSQMGKSWK